jgi:hypothetical protein
LYNTLKQIHPEVCHSFMRRLFITVLVWGCLILAACLPLNGAPVTEAPLATETPTPAPTIVWFPASATPTLNAIPTYSATPEMNPGIGEVILRDRFTETKVWDTVASDQASVLLKEKQLILAVEPGNSVASLRRDMTFGNFYVELTARIGLCRAADTYGLLIRAIGDNFYRFNLSCNGLITVERIKSGERLTLLEPTASGDVPLGPPGEVKIGIWAMGGEMRLFLNERYQFSILEKTFPSGAFGVFVKSNGDTPVTIAFSDLSVYEVEYIAPTRTPGP